MRWGLLVGLFLWGTSVEAQTPPVTNPQTVEFTASTDHNTIDETGTPILQRYELRLYYALAPLPWATYDLGKPDPVGELITVKNPAWFIAPSAGQVCFARVVSIGAGGEGVSEPSNNFYSFGAPGAVTDLALTRR